MGMSFKKKFELRDYGRSRISNIFHAAKTYGSNHMELNNMYLEFVNKHPKSLPRWIKSYWEGIRDVHMDLTYRYELEFCYIIDGVRVSTWKQSPIYYETLGYNVRQLCDCPCGHYWIKTGKPFFEGNPKTIKEK
jgi:hypothetical protein